MKIYTAYCETCGDQRIVRETKGMSVTPKTDMPSCNCGKTLQVRIETVGREQSAPESEECKGCNKSTTEEVNE